MSVPANPKIYHIVHVDRLQSIAAEGLLCDAEIIRNPKKPGTAIGMDHIKQRRLRELHLQSHPKLFVGDCVPFYFCPRSVMLYVIHRAVNPDLSYRDGQSSIVHLEADLHKTVAWAKAHGLCWAFTRSNAGARYFEDWCDLAQLNQINWRAIQARQWNTRDLKVGKQAEFLVERRFPWQLIERIGVQTQRTSRLALQAISAAAHKPPVLLKPAWYY